jgi:hypothetical protein
MRKLATVFSLVVLCVTSASAQWNLAQDPAASLNDKAIAQYSATKTSSGLDIQLKTEGSINDEVFIWRTGTGTTAYTVADASVYDPTLITVPTEAALEAQCKAAILEGVATGLQVRPSTDVTQTKAWFSYGGTVRSMNFEIKWGTDGVVVNRLPDDVVTSTVQ